MGGGEGLEGGVKRPKGRKTAERRLKEKANNTGVELLTAQMKDLRSSNTNISQVFKDFVKTSKDDKAHKMLIRKQKLRVHEDRTMMMDSSTMTPEQVACIEQRRAEIMQRSKDIHHQLNNMSSIPLII